MSQTHDKGLKLDGKSVFNRLCPANQCSTPETQEWNQVRNFGIHPFEHVEQTTLDNGSSTSMVRPQPDNRVELIAICQEVGCSPPWPMTAPLTIEIKRSNRRKYRDHCFFSYVCIVTPQWCPEHWPVNM